MSASFPMIPDATFEPAPPQRQLRLRFSLLALLILVTLICFGLALLVQPNRVVATALFKVSTSQPIILGGATSLPNDEQNFFNVKKTQIAMLQSYSVLSAALRDPKIAGLPMLQSQEDPVAWLENHLETDFPQEGEILAISLRGPEAHAQELVQIVDAIAKAYRDEVIYAEKQRRLTSRDLLARSLDSLKKQIERTHRELLDIAREGDRLESGSGQVKQELDLKRIDRVETEILRLENEQLLAEIGGSEGGEAIKRRIEQLQERQEELQRKIEARAEQSVESTARQRELERLEQIAHQMAIKLEMLDIEANAPERIRQLQPAVVSRVD